MRGVSPNRLCLSLSVIMLVCTWSEGREGDKLSALEHTGCNVGIKNKENIVQRHGRCF